MFKRSIAAFEDELTQLKIGDRHTLRAQLAALRAELAELSGPQDELQRRALGGRLAGVKKRWRSFLISALTSESLGGLGESRPGRERVRAWQQQVFGHSLSSRDLADYAQPERAGGGRGAPVPLDVAPGARQIFESYMRRFDQLWRSS